MDSSTPLLMPAGPGRIAAVLVIAVTGIVVWIATREPASTTVFPLVAIGLWPPWIGIDRARRRLARKRREKSDLRREAYVAHIATRLRLDRRIQAALGFDERHSASEGWRISRTPMAHGRGSRFINYVQLTTLGGAADELVEKGVDSDSDELSFWRTANVDSLALSGNSYRTLAPIDIAHGDPVSVMYFRYLPALDRETPELRRDFRQHLPAITAAVAEFNGRNRLPDHGGGASRYPFPPRPSASDLQLRMNVSVERADDVLRLVDRVRSDWSVISDAYSSLPRCLCHNDISPGNAVHMDGIVTFGDFGLASPGPIGSDLHTIIRWSAGKMYEPGHVENLLTSYVEAIRPYYRAVSLSDVSLAAWTTFYLRYTNLKYSSARYERPFRFALEQLSVIIGQLKAA